MGGGGGLPSAEKNVIAGEQRLALPGSSVATSLVGDRTRTGWVRRYESDYASASDQQRDLASKNGVGCGQPLWQLSEGPETRESAMWNLICRVVVRTR